MHITTQHVRQFLQRVAEIIHDHRDELTHLDVPIGDADHGMNLDRGFSTVAQTMIDHPADDIGTLLRSAGMTLISTVGGTSGPLYGTAFIRAATLLANRQSIDMNLLVEALVVALDGIRMRGKSDVGEKTMIDAIAPGVAVLVAARDRGDLSRHTFHEALDAVEAGMKATIPMLATKGRAAYLGERSIGHQDPGATSAFYLAQVLVETLESIPDHE